LPDFVGVSIAKMPGDYQSITNMFASDATELPNGLPRVNPVRSNFVRLIGFLMIMGICVSFVSPGLTASFTEVKLASPFVQPENIVEKLAEKSEEEKRSLFLDFQQTHLKTYADSNELDSRFEIFKLNLAKIDEMNSKRPLAKFHISKFSDLSPEEFKSYNRLGTNFEEDMNEIISLSAERQTELGFVPYEKTDFPEKVKTASTSLPTSFDWRDHGAVNPVRDQGQCGSCWAFSATGDMEGTWALKTGNLVNLSEQELVSCDPRAYGCEGGLMSAAYQYVIKNKGIETEPNYPYKSGTTQQNEECDSKLESSPTHVTVDGWTMIKPGTVDDLKATLHAVGPIAIGVKAEQMQFYSSGIDVCETPTSTNEIDHGVLLVGYGSKDGDDYWIIKNSWGPKWGNEGYYYVSTANGACGVGLQMMKSI